MDWGSFRPEYAILWIIESNIARGKRPILVNIVIFASKSRHNNNIKTRDAPIRKKWVSSLYRVCTHPTHFPRPRGYILWEKGKNKEIISSKESRNQSNWPLKARHIAHTTLGFILVVAKNTHRDASAATRTLRRKTFGRKSTCLFIYHI